MWQCDVDATDSEWNVYELWKETLGLEDGLVYLPDDRLWPSVSGGGVGWVITFSLFPDYFPFVKPLRW